MRGNKPAVIVGSGRSDPRRILAGELQSTRPYVSAMRRQSCSAPKGAEPLLQAALRRFARPRSLRSGAPAQCPPRHTAARPFRSPARSVRLRLLNRALNERQGSKMCSQRNCRQDCQLRFSRCVAPVLCQCGGRHAALKQCRFCMSGNVPSRALKQRCCMSKGLARSFPSSCAGLVQRQNGRQEGCRAAFRGAPAPTAGCPLGRPCRLPRP